MPSSSLIPKDDPSVLLTTAGMQQFKDWFSGKAAPEHNRVVTIQKCVRTGDIEEVGKTNRHLTFFEMLGNFSFGDYFKEDAIKWGYEFISKKLGVSDDRIHFTIFKGDSEVPRDDESEKVIKSIGDFKIEEYDRDDNFWGPTGSEGPCGPTAEIYVDGIEIWNLVFNEYYMQPDKVLLPLEKKGVDTGAGLERIAASINKLPSVYDTDEMGQIIQYVRPFMVKGSEKAEKIIADHARTAAFLLADGVRPSNLDKGYVLKRVIRRMVRYAKLSGVTEQNLCSKIAEKVIEIYGPYYPNLKTEKAKIVSELNIEEEKFSRVIENGIKKLDELSVKGNDISGEEAFELFATYGFPLELTQEMAAEKGIKVDQAGFEAQFEKHQEVSRAGMNKKFAGGMENKEDPQIIKYHTAAHLLLAALRSILGDQVHQKGSNLTAERLRFDFSNDEKLTDEEKKKVEDWVNDKIKQNIPVTMVELSPEEAKKAGAEGEFTAKYGDKVKVYSIGDASKEICGGPHVKNTAELGHFRIVKEESSSSGVRRIKAVLE